MGTKITLYVAGSKAQHLISEACSMLLHYEEVFSANRNDSPLALLKKNAFLAPQKVDSELYELIKVGKSHSEGEDNYLNIAIGPLIKLWRIGFAEAKVPANEAVANVLELLKPDQIQLDDEKQTVFFLKEGIEIDLGAIAKGYFCDHIMNFFKAGGTTSAMIDIGGNVLVFGESPSHATDWNVGIQNPFLPRGNAVALVKIRDQSVVTSGIYERVLEKDGEKYHHIFDSRTGYPIESKIASLTIIADKSLDCDIYTTKLFGLDPASILKKVNKIERMGAIVITKDGKLAHTDNLHDKITVAASMIVPAT